MSLSAVQILIIAFGGAVGGAARFWVSGLVARRAGETFPWDPLTVNVTGSAAIGLLAAWLLPHLPDDAGAAALWASLATGILGSYTTVSSFSLQTLELTRKGELLRAGLNVFASLTLCLGAVAAGYVAGRWFAGA